MSRVAYLAALLVVLALGRVPGGWEVEAALWIVLLAAVAFRPPVALFALVVGNFLGLRTFPTGTYTDLPLSLGLIAIGACAWIAESASRWRLDELRTAPGILIFGLGAAATLSLCLAQSTYYPPIEHAPLRAQIGGLAAFWASGAVALMAMRWGRGSAQLAPLLWVFLWLGGLFCAIRFVPELGFLSQQLAPGINGSMVWTWTIALAFAQAVENGRLALAQRFVLLVLVAVLLWTGLAESRGWLAGWVPALAALVLIVLRTRPRLAVALVIAIGGVFLWKPDRLIGLVMAGDNTYSLATRLEAAGILLRIASLRPLFGLGPANYYPATAAYEIRGYAVNFSSHNNYIDLLAQTGIVGLVLFLAVFALALWRTWKMVALAEDGMPRAFALGALGGLGGTLVAALLGDWVVPFVYNLTLSQLSSSTFAWLFLGCALALPGAAPPRARLVRGS